MVFPGPDVIDVAVVIRNVSTAVLTLPFVTVID